MNDLVVGDPAEIPVVYRPRVGDIAAAQGPIWSGWDNDMWDLRNWYRET